MKNTVNSKVLPNKLTLVTVNIPSFHSVTNFLVIRSGSRYETPKNNGVAHFLEHMVFKGTKSYEGSKEIAEAIEGIGGYFNAWTSNDHTAYYNTVPSSQWRRGINVPFELAFTPKLRKEDMERERGVIIEEIRRMNDDPSSLADDRLGEILFPNNSIGYSVIGSEETINNMKIEDFKDYHTAHYAPSQAYFVAVGDLEGKDIESAVLEECAHLSEKPISKTEYIKKPSKKALKLLNKKTDQTHFLLGSSDPILSGNNNNQAVAAVLNAVLGSGMSSRLFLNIREKKGLAYSINSGYYSFEDTGAIVIYGGVNTQKIAMTLEALNEEFEKLMTEEVGEVELNKAKSLIQGSYDLRADRPIDIATWYGTSFLLGNKRTFEQAKEEISAVTAKQIKDLAQILFVKDRLALSVVGPYETDEIFASYLELK
ncbi:insulinase family protein [Candidatus Berkelbacteria bacterium]|nr:insulinase family protein [Candidatus Berkelbacteria bacterium]